jgi:hypothetical protein
MFDIARDSWRKSDRPGQPRLLCGCYYSVGPAAKDDLAAYFRDYYPGVLPGQVEQLMAAVTTVSADAIRAAVKRFEDIGCDELIFVPTTPDLAHLDGLAELLF